MIQTQQRCLKGLEWINYGAASLANELCLICPSLAIVLVNTLKHCYLRWLQCFFIQNWLDAPLEIENLVALNGAVNQVPGFNNLHLWVNQCTTDVVVSFADAFDPDMVHLC